DRVVRRRDVDDVAVGQSREDAAEVVADVVADHGVAGGVLGQAVLDADAVEAVGRDDVERAAEQAADGVAGGVLDQDAVVQVGAGAQAAGRGDHAGDGDVGPDLVVDDDVALRRDSHDVDAV